MSDLIKRSDAIDAIHCSVEIQSRIGAMVMERAITDITKNILDIPAAEAPTWEWISCSDRMPPDQAGVLVAVLDKHLDEYATIARWDGERWFDDNNEPCADIVVAWTPLPAIWEEEKLNQTRGFVNYLKKSMR